MKIRYLGAGARLTVAGLALSSLAACASAQSESRPVVQQVEEKQAAAAPVEPPAPAPAARPASTVSELQGLIQARQVSELRTTYNGSYGASLLYKPDELTYYVALFQQKDFWRVLKTKSVKQAESTYRAFASKTAELAEVDIQRIRLQAEYAHAEKQLGARNAELTALQADQALRQQQEQQVAARQAQSRQEADALSEQRQEVRSQLRAMQRQIDALQAEQARVAAPAKRGK